MSYKLVDKVFETDGLTKIERLVLMSLAKHAHNDGTGAFPSIETMMRQSSSCHGSVCRALRSLKSKEYIRESHPGMVKGGRWKTVHYTLLTDNWKPFPEDGNHTQIEPFELLEEKPSNLRTETVQSVTETVQTVSETIQSTNGNRPQIGHESMKNQLTNMSANQSSISQAKTATDDDDQLASKQASGTVLKKGQPSSQSEMCPTKKRQVTEEEVVKDLDLLFPRFLERGGSFWANAEQRHIDLYVHKARQKGLPWVRAVVIEFALSDNKFDKMICPAAVLMSRWDDYEKVTEEEMRRGQHRALWGTAVEIMGGYGDKPMSGSQKDRVRELCARYGTGRIEDAYCNFDKNGASGLDAFLHDPTPYLKAAA